jgi:hypothetical protein
MNGKQENGPLQNHVYYILTTQKTPPKQSFPRNPQNIYESLDYKKLSITISTAENFL